jgi:ribonucleoside-diphosphate reductase alpha chain
MLDTQLQQYIHLSRYARWREDLGRRETWEETVERYFSFWHKRLAPHLDEGLLEDLYVSEAAVINLEVMPSMRALMTAGPALERDEVAGYNCSYIAMDNVRCFDEIMYILMCGTGVGFSVERQYVNQLPEVAADHFSSDTTIVVADSKIGWATATREMVSLLYSGRIPKWDLSRVRPAGARLKVFGGRASGPAPLDELFRFLVQVFTGAKGRKLSSIEVHDIVCKIADVVVVGGVRRSALLSLSNLTDERMRHAKSGQWWEREVQRALANNSVAYTEKPDVGIFLKEWHNLYESKSGERGIFNRVGSTKQAAKSGRRDLNYDFGTNPCGEIILRPGGLCNLSEIIVRSGDDARSLQRKARIASFLGTLQSTLTNFRYLRPLWRKNAEEERLLGVSLTGIMDHDLLGRSPPPTFLEMLKQIVIDENKRVSDLLGINASVATTTIKPSGTVSQLVNSASGIHPRYSRHYLRTVRADKKDPLAQFMRAQGFPVEDDVTKPDNTDVFYFPQKAPEGATLRNNISAIEQLEHYLIYKRYWCEHNPSITIYVREHEWVDVAAWVFKNFDDIGGVSFLPHTDHIYRQAPYQEIDEVTYNSWLVKMPQGVDWTDLKENHDETTASHELACSAGVCEL